MTLALVLLALALGGLCGCLFEHLRRGGSLDLRRALEAMPCHCEDRVFDTTSELRA